MGLLAPICDRIVAALFTSDLLHLDGTGVKTLQPGEKGAQRGQFTVYCNRKLTCSEGNPIEAVKPWSRETLCPLGYNPIATSKPDFVASKT